ISDRSAAATPTAATAAAEAGLCGRAVRCERRRELLDHLRGAALGARRIGVGHPHQLLEVGLAAHADVVVDRHADNPSTALLASQRDGYRYPAKCRASARSWSETMFDSVTVIGAGRAGSAIAARLRERGVRLSDDGGLRLLCVPDRAIGQAARAIAVGPWVAHVSGATPLAELAPHVRRFSVHPLQTLTTERGPEQLDGAWAAITGESPEALGHARDLAETLGLRPFVLADDRRALYHAGASMASNFLVTLHRAASRLLDDAGAPPESLTPLMERTIENGFDLTGPIARGDGTTIERHLAAIRAEEPTLEPLYVAFAEATRAWRSYAPS